MTVDPTPIRTLVVDDHRSYAEALTMALARVDAIEPIACAHSVAEALDSVRRNSPDVVLIDWQMPDIDGLDAIGRVKAIRPATSVIVISGHASPELERLAHMSGAAAMLPKQSSVADIVNSIRRCSEGETLQGAKTGARPARVVSLTPRESEILWLLAKGRDTQRIADELVISVHTVRGYVKTLRAKFGATSRLEVVAIARELGMIPS